MITSARAAGFWATTYAASCGIQFVDQHSHRAPPSRSCARSIRTFSSTITHTRTSHGTATASSVTWMPSTITGARVTESSSPGSWLVQCQRWYVAEPSVSTGS